jgi:hypothetical protein
MQYAGCLFRFRRKLCEIFERVRVVLLQEVCPWYLISTDLVLLQADFVSNSMQLKGIGLQSRYRY